MQTWINKSYLSERCRWKCIVRAQSNYEIFKTWYTPDRISWQFRPIRAKLIYTRRLVNLLPSTINWLAYAKETSADEFEIRIDSSQLVNSIQLKEFPLEIAIKSFLTVDGIINSSRFFVLHKNYFVNCNRQIKLITIEDEKYSIFIHHINLKFYILIYGIDKPGSWTKLYYFEYYWIEYYFRYFIYFHKLHVRRFIVYNYNTVLLSIKFFKLVIISYFFFFCNLLPFLNEFIRHSNKHISLCLSVSFFHFLSFVNHEWTYCLIKHKHFFLFICRTLYLFSEKSMLRLLNENNSKLKISTKVERSSYDRPVIGG